MLGRYAFQRDDIIESIEKSEVTPDGYYFCPNFKYDNCKVGKFQDKGYKFNRELFKDKICFTREDLEAYSAEFDESTDYFNISDMYRRDNFVNEIISPYKTFTLNEPLPDVMFTLSELIDNAIFKFNQKYL